MSEPTGPRNATGPRRLPNGWVVDEVSRSETNYLYREIVLDRLYTAPHLPQRPALVVDVGANIGLFALHAVQTWQPRRLICIEAIADIRELLRANLARNVDANTSILTPDVAAGAAAGTSEFVFYPRYSMMSGRFADPTSDFALVRGYAAGQLGDDEALAALDDVLRSRFEAQRREVRVEPLSQICADAGTDVIDLLKIDVEGDELTVLLGLGDLGVRNAVVEVDERRSSKAAVRAALEARGLSVEETTQDGYEDSPLSVLFAGVR